MAETMAFSGGGALVQVVVMVVVVSHSTVVMVGMRGVSSQLGAILGFVDSRQSA